MAKHLRGVIWSQGIALGSPVVPLENRMLVVANASAMWGRAPAAWSGCSPMEGAAGVHQDDDVAVPSWSGIGAKARSCEKVRSPGLSCTETMPPLVDGSTIALGAFACTRRA